MKHQINKKLDFVPVSLTLTFESQRELDVFGSLLNCSPFWDVMNDMGLTMPDYTVGEELGAKNIRHTAEIISRLIKHPSVVYFVPRNE